VAGALRGRPGRLPGWRVSWLDLAVLTCAMLGAPTCTATARRLRLAAGFVVAALRCRLDDAADLAWRPVDALLSSWHGSNLATFVPVTVAVGLVLTRDGLYGLITDADNLGVIAGAPWAAIKGLRKYRQISTPKRPEKKASSVGEPER
jgi:hypothetical protein